MVDRGDIERAVDITGAATAAIAAYAPGLSVPAALVGAGVQILGGVLGGLLEDSEAVAGAVRREQVAELTSERVVADLRRNFKLLEANGKSPSVSDVTSVFQAFNKCWLNADPDKRDLLRNAFVNAFSPGLYESGILGVLFAKVDALSYGDLLMLRVVVTEDPLWKDRMTVEQNWALFQGRNDRAIGGLVPFPTHSSNPLADFHFEQLVEHKLCQRDVKRHEARKTDGSSASIVRYAPTPLGTRVIELVQECRLEEEVADL